MIITRTPFRVSLFGGGTDYPTWFREHGGAVLGTAIDKYCYLSVRPLPPFFSHRHRIVYSQVELVQDASEIRHPAVRAVLQDMAIATGLEIHHDADLPARSGLGSSSAFTVGLLNALHALHGAMISKPELSRTAIRIEQEVLHENVGCQDQIWAAHGGFNRIDFHPDGSFTIIPLVLNAQHRTELEQSMALVFTGLSRISSEVAQEQIENMQDRRMQLYAMRQMVDEAMKILERRSLSVEDLGRLLHESWRMKRQLSARVASATIDEIYDAGIAAGAYGGKLLGAGGGGFMLFLVPSDRRQAFRAQLSSLIHVPIHFDFGGSRVVIYEPNGLDHA